jgi:ABC-type lipoprotein release transport system permease subunit
VPQIRQAFADVHPSLPLNSPTTLDEYTSLPLFPVRLGTAVLSSLGGIALLLACAGLYGVVAFRVTQRWNELAVRLALGATPSNLMRLIVGDGLRNAAGGLVLGLILAVVAIRMIASRLPRVQAMDPAVLIGATGLLATVALIAAVLPALRAWWVNPASVLKGE